MSPPDWSAEPLHRRSRRHRQGSYALPTRLKKEAGGRETAERTMTRETSRTAAHDGREAGHDTPISVPPSGNPDGCLCPVRQIGRAQLCTPVTNAQLICPPLLEKKKRHTKHHI